MARTRNLKHFIMSKFPDLSAPIRSAIVGSAEITALLPAYLNSYPVFTRRPLPNDTPRLSVMVGQDIAANHEDGVNDRRLAITREIVVSGENDRDWLAVDQIARLIAKLFHRQPQNLTVPDWKVVQITAKGRGGPPLNNLEPTVSMVVTLSITLAAPH